MGWWARHLWPLFLPTPKNYFWQLPMDKHAFMGAWESSGGISVTYWSTKSENRHIKEVEKNNFLLPASQLPEGFRAQCQGRPQPVIFPKGHMRANWAPSFPSCVGHGSRGPFLYRLITERISILKYFELARIMKNGWDSQNPGLGTQKLDAFLLNTLQTEARGSLMNLTGYLTCRSSQKHTQAASTPHILSSRNQQNS